MTATELAVGDWIDRLTPALARLVEAQEPYLDEYYTRNSAVRVLSDKRGGRPPFPLGDVRMLYSMARHSHVLGEEKYYASLCEVLDPVRALVRSHPALARVASRTVGRDEFFVYVFHSGHVTAATDLIAGLMARASELSGDRFRTAARELNALLTPVTDDGSSSVLRDLDVAYDLVLFYGLAVKERVDVVEGMAILPFEQVRAFVDEDFVNDLLPSRAAFDGWRSVGAVVNPFRWRPLFHRTESLGELRPRNPEPFFRAAQACLDLLAVAHAAPVLSIAAFGQCVYRSAHRLLGWEHYRGSEHGRRSAERFDVFDECPEISPGALDQAKAAFERRRSDAYARMASIVSRLSEALAREGIHAREGRIVDVAMALEQMYQLPERRISRTLQDRIAGYLGSDAASREQIKKSVKEFYDARSKIVHSRRRELSPQINRAIFLKGFEIASKSLFKLLNDGPPANWDQS